ncbi:MAG: hypothetical protein C4516_05215 [Oxalobacter sp.]|nr:MAG: hypothetical protein C4516_05215 [Oxalobacter sp.]
MKIDGIPNPEAMADELKRMKHAGRPATATGSTTPPPTASSNEEEDDDDELIDLMTFERDKWTPCS